MNMISNNILDEIVRYKLEAVSEQKELVPVKLLEKSVFYETESVSLKEYILREDKLGIIAEIKRQSPSGGVINSNISIERTSIGYMQAGASALSVLTDTRFFGGSNEDLIIARKFNYCPILRKDFIVDTYQIIEAKSIGSDAVLLIAAILDESKLTEFARFSKSLGLEVLVEIRSQKELYDSITESADVIGVNNRNLETFDVDINNSIDLLPLLPGESIKISESGISTPDDLITLKNAGFDGFLIGGLFMSHSRPEKACHRFIKEVKALRGSNGRIK